MTRSPRSISSKRLVLAGLFGLCSLPACAPEEGAEIALNYGRVPLAVTTPCSGATDAEYLTETLDGLRLKVSGPGMKSMQKTYSTSSKELVMDKVPVGDNRTVQVNALRGSLSLWRGMSKGIQVAANKSSTAEVFLTRVSDLTCARSPLQDGRAFHTATPLPDGRVLITGGVTQDTASTGCTPAGSTCRTLTATASADIFDPKTGRMFSTGSMGRARAFHTAVALDDGRVVVVGGSSSATLNTAAAFPFIPAQAILEIEVFNPKTNLFSDVGMDVEGRAFAAGITIPSGPNKGAALISGGGSPSIFEVIGAGADTQMRGRRSSVICKASGSAVLCAAGPDMAMRRAGHVMAPLSDGSVLVFGGNMESGTEAGLDDSGNTRQVFRQSPELFLGEGFAFPKDRPAYFEGSGRANNVFFGAAVPSPAWGGVFVVGGLIRNDDTQSMRFQDPEQATPGGNAKGAVWFVAEGQNVVTNNLGAGVLQLQSPRYFLSAAQTHDSGNFVVAGGVRGTLGIYEASTALDLFDSETSLMKTISVGGQARTLRQARAGLTATPLPAGTALLVGGLSKDGANPTVADTAEIYTDQEEPR